MVRHWKELEKPYDPPYYLKELWGVRDWAEMGRLIFYVLIYLTIIEIDWMQRFFQPIKIYIALIH